MTKQFYGNSCTHSGPLHRGKHIFIFHHMGFRGNPGFVNHSSIMNKGEDECAKYSGHIHSGLASSGQHRMILRCPVFMCVWTEQACNVVVIGLTKYPYSSPIYQPSLPIWLSVWLLPSKTVLESKIFLYFWKIVL